MELKTKTQIDKDGSTKLMKRFVFSDSKTGIEGCIWVPRKYETETTTVEVKTE